MNFFVNTAHAALDAYVSTSTTLASNVASTLFNALLNLISVIIPYAIGILVFYIGYRLARRALGGS